MDDMTQMQDKLSGLSSAKKAVLRDLLRRKRPAEGATDRIEPREDRLAPLPLSFSQLRLWFLDRLHPGDPVYNLPSATRILGSLHLPSLALALAGVADRHEALRTTFAATEDGEPVQVIAPRFVPRLPVVDLGALPAARRNPEIRRMSALESRLAFDLEKGPLLRGCVFRCTDDEHLLLLVMHHIVSDGWSIGVLVNEIGALYPAFLAGQPSPLPELPVQYPDFAVWQRRRLSGARLEAELDWWRSRLAGMSPVLELPADHPRQAVRSSRGAGRTFLMDPAALSGLQALSLRHETTLFRTLLAGFFAVLQRYTGEDDLAVATPIAGRIRSELGPLIGFFVNTLVLRTDLGGNPSFSDLLTRVRETTLSSYSHQELPFERLVEDLAPERDLGRPPLVQVMFTMENIPEGALEHPGIEIIPEAAGLQVAQFELTCTFREIEEGLLGTLDYSRELFEGPTMVRLGGHFERLLSGVLAEPQRPLAEIALLAPGERHQLLAEWNDTAVGYPRGHTLHELVAAQADRGAPRVRTAGRAQGFPLPGRSHRAREDHHRPLRALDAGGVPGDAGARSAGLAAPGGGERRGPAAAARAALLLPPPSGRAAQPVRADRGVGRRELLALRSRASRRCGPDRPADRQPPAPCGGPHSRAATGRGSGRAAARRSGARARLSRTAGSDRGGVHPRSVRRRTGRAALPHRRPGAPAGRRHGALPRPHRPSGEDPRLPHRAGGDRGGAGGAPRGHRRGRAGARRGE